jgi:hypothetical protein
MFKIATIAAAAAFAVAAPASAATIIFQTTWEADQVPGGPTPGTFIIYNNPPTTSVAGWTPETQIELQNNVAGAPAPGVGGSVFAELDADFNSSMSRMIGPGIYSLTYLYSPRPGVPQSSNGIGVTIGGVAISQTEISGLFGPNTAWSQINTQEFTVGPGGALLRFSANGTSDSFGGYVDNITLIQAVPEPSTWAMFILGFGVLGFAMRRRNAKVTSAKASLRFA